MSDTEIIFEVNDDEVDEGYAASALGYGIHTEGDSLNELRRNVKEAVDCYFDETMPRPKLIRLHFVREEVPSREIASRRERRGSTGVRCESSQPVDDMDDDLYDTEQVTEELATEREVVA